jgi:hypothetical protein
VRFIRNTPGLVPLAERQASKLLDTATVERRLVQAIVPPSSPLIGEPARQKGRAEDDMPVSRVVPQCPVPPGLP